MSGLLIRWFVNAVALWLTSKVVKGIEIHGVPSLLFSTMMLGFLNAFLRPLLLLITLPLNILTLGLLTFLINGFMLKLTAAAVVGFEVHGFWAAVLGAFMLSVISFALNLFVSDAGRIEYIYIHRVR